MGRNLGTLTVWRTPAARARAGQPPLDLHRTREGYAKLEEWTALEWMGQCERMTIHVDDKDSREPKPVLVAAKRSEIYVCYLDEGLRRYKIDIRALDVHSFGDFNVSSTTLNVHPLTRRKSASTTSIFISRTHSTSASSRAGRARRSCRIPPARVALNSRLRQ